MPTPVVIGRDWSLERCVGGEGLGTECRGTQLRGGGLFAQQLWRCHHERGAFDVDALRDFVVTQHGDVGDVRLEQLLHDGSHLRACDDDRWQAA